MPNTTSICDISNCSDYCINHLSDLLSEGSISISGATFTDIKEIKPTRPFEINSFICFSGGGQNPDVCIAAIARTGINGNRLSKPRCVHIIHNREKDEIEVMGNDITRNLLLRARLSDIVLHKHC